MLLQQSRQEKNFWVKVREDSNLWHSNIAFLAELRKISGADLAKESNFK